MALSELTIFFELFSYAPVGNIGLQYQVMNGKLVLTWSSGTLVTGSDVYSVTNPVAKPSPYTNDMSGGAQYFRLKVH